MDAISRQLISLALKEDIGAGDSTTIMTVPEDMYAAGEIKAKADGVVCGIGVVKEVFRQVDGSIKFRPLAKDGDKVKPGALIVVVEGRARSLLAAERTALNFLQRLSGVATETAKYVEAAVGTKAKVLDTRKTEPGMRALQKYAVRCGGGKNHRMGLYDMVLIKENHIKAAGGIGPAVKAARKVGLKVEVETENLDEVKEALRAGADIIMFDDMKPGNIKKAVRLVAGRAVTEASGGINLSNAAKIASTGVDTFSVGSITHSYRALDISMKIRVLQ
jgi:nicotinate-nucleotide pyrophosphorylase (carboxylating)